MPSYNSSRDFGNIKNFQQLIKDDTNERIFHLRNNFANDFLYSHVYIYPLQGLLEILTYPIYWKYLLLLGVCYTIIFLINATIIYLFLLPMLLGLSVILLGPLGAILMHIQWILQSTLITTYICKKIIIPNFKYQIYKIAIEINGMIKTKNLRGYQNNGNVNGMESTTRTDLFWLFPFSKYVKKVIYSLFKFVLSMIPILGPILVKLLGSYKRGYKYMKIVFYSHNIDKSQIKSYRRQHSGSFIAFGIVAGMLELLPILSIVTMTSNIVGAAKWEVQMLKDDTNID